MGPNPFGPLLDAVSDEVWPAVEAAALSVPSLRYTLAKASRISPQAWDRLYHSAPHPKRLEFDEALALGALVGRPLTHAQRMAVLTTDRSSHVLTALISHNQLTHTELAVLGENPGARAHSVMGALLATAAHTPLDLRELATSSGPKSLLMWVLHTAEHLTASEVADLVATSTHELSAKRGAHTWATAMVEAIFDQRPEALGLALSSADVLVTVAAASSRVLDDTQVEAVANAIACHLTPNSEQPGLCDKDGTPSIPRRGVEAMRALAENPYAPTSVGPQVRAAVQPTLSHLTYRLRSEAQVQIAHLLRHHTQTTAPPAKVHDPQPLCDYVVHGTRPHPSILCALALNPRLTPFQLAELHKVATEMAAASLELRAWLAPTLARLSARLPQEKQAPRTHEPLPTGLVARLLPEHFEPEREVELVLPGGGMQWLTAYGHDALVTELATLATGHLGHDTGAWETFFSLAEGVEVPVGDLLDSVVGVHRPK